MRIGPSVREFAGMRTTSLPHYADDVIGDYMTEAVFPAILHQDPPRLGPWTVQFPEIAGHSTAVAISMAYYPENRDAADGLSKLGSQPGVDLTSNILKEFWPDLGWKFSRKHKSTGNGSL
jgi:hypothetical protein